MTTRVACVVLMAAALGCSSPSRTPVDGSEQSYDAEPLHGEFGDGCSKHTDCTLGFCVEPVGSTGGVCSRTCKNDCPEGWECRNVHLPQVDLDLCVPAAQQLCLACANDAECGGATCLQIDGQGRCATACSGQCPVGYACTADASGMHPGSYCQPVTGSCSCSQGLAGASRSCSNANASGTCFGTQTCNPGSGWSTCTAKVPSAETCDGTDNDCNFIIDDGVGGGQACMNTVSGVGSCPGVRACDGSTGFVCIGQTPSMESCNYVDDNCNGSVDEIFKSGTMALGTTCQMGTGACTRYGSYVCNSNGTGTQCSATPGAPGTELCNQIDDNCNGSVDETYKTGAMALGTTCSAGDGICARYGSYVCQTNGMGTQCSAMAANVATAETCNYLDDDCNKVVDNGFVNAGGLYNTDQNCGSCGNNCTTQFTAQNSYGACQVGTSAQCVMRCNPNTGNLNNSTVDGCEFVIDATGIYVSTTDTTAVDDGTCGIGPTGTGTGNHPCKTITYGLSRAVSATRANVLVADGTYNEGVTLIAGKNVLGGYRADTWERHVSTTNTVIAGSTTVGSNDRGVSATGINTATVFEGFVVRGSFNSKPGGNSYAVYIATSTPALVIKNNQIIGGRGGAGLAGTPGNNGFAGTNGGGTSDPSSTTYAATSVSTCSGMVSPSFTIRQYTNGGTQTCGSDVVDGGRGGGNWCPPSYGSHFTGVPKQPDEMSAIDGVAGQPGAGAGGGAAGTGNDAGDDSFLYGNTCYVPAGSTFGGSGTNGSAGSAAGGVAGCSASNGSVSGGEWSAGKGSDGLGGSNGGGGGGGGAGGGSYCYMCSIGNNQYHRIGGHGGGGGSGGCGGTGGSGGLPGGGVFGIFVTGGSAPTITNNVITRGAGGDGGTGGLGGAGGLGGTGGGGGGSTVFCTDKAGRGGDGGNGGAGSGGGGGCGGSSFGIFTSGVGTPTYCSNNTVSGGSFGAGGAGGFSGGSSGSSGAAGVLGGCTSI